MHGSGIETWPDGKKYEGQYHIGMMQGMGKYSWPDGKCYNGQWVEGK